MAQFSLQPQGLQLFNAHAASRTAPSSQPSLLPLPTHPRCLQGCQLSIPPQGVYPPMPQILTLSVQLCVGRSISVSVARSNPFRAWCALPLLHHPAPHPRTPAGHTKVQLSGGGLPALCAGGGGAGNSQVTH